MDVLTDCVGANKGLLNKYMGDSIMAVFGAPVPSTTEEEFRRDAQNAIRCALCMRRALAKLNARWARDGLPLIGMRVGIFTGPVIAGSMGKAGAGGSTGRLEYTVIGDTVNTASRLESFDKALMDGDIAADNCRILVGAPTLDLLGGRFRTRYIGTEGLKGKGGKVAIHGVIREAEVAAGAAVTSAPASAPAPTSST
jgi:adenylate cyclase